MSTYTIRPGAHRPSPLAIPCPRTARTVRFRFVLDTRAGSIETPDKAWSKVAGWKWNSRGLRLGFAQWGNEMRFCAYQTMLHAPKWKAHDLVAVPATGLIEGEVAIHASGLLELTIGKYTYAAQTAAKLPGFYLTSGPWFGGQTYRAPATTIITLEKF